MILENMSCRLLAEDVIKAARILYERGANTLSSGNISARCSEEDYIILTPTGLGKNELKLGDLVFYDMTRDVFIGFRRPTSEFRAHLMVYSKGAKHVRAIAHAHVPYALKAFRKRGLRPFSSESLVEARYVLGKVCSAKPYPPGSFEIASEIANLSLICDVVIVSEHGAFAYDKTPLAAAERLLALEYIGFLSLT